MTGFLLRRVLSALATMIVSSFAFCMLIAVPRRRTEPPELRELSSGHFAARHLR
jgi:hypothetical protein